MLMRLCQMRISERPMTQWAWQETSTTKQVVVLIHLLHIQAFSNKEDSSKVSIQNNIFILFLFSKILMSRFSVTLPRFSTWEWRARDQLRVRIYIWTWMSVLWSRWTEHRNKYNSRRKECAKLATDRSASLGHLQADARIAAEEGL